MIEKTIIKVQGLHKKFTRSLKRSMLYGSMDLARGMLGLRRPDEVLRPSEFWALRDVNFEVKRGEALGLIGSNGSGKTTLLRVLSGIFPPDRGEVRITGRIGALIALGAGFHPHMTGRENIYLNAAILGMSRIEIEAKFDEIVAFAEIGDFLDAPVSTYSSGMRVRLGFSVAIHCEPDIVLVDEVLAVGDAAFRAKSISKLASFLEDKAVIIVSHSMYQIESLSQKVLWLEKGRIRRYGDTAEVINEYLDYQEYLAHENARKVKLQMNSAVFKLDRSLNETTTHALPTSKSHDGHILQIQQVELLDAHGNPTDKFPFFSCVKIKITYHAFQKVETPLFNVRFCYGQKGLFENSMLIDGPVVDHVGPGDGWVELTIGRLPLTPKMYDVVVFIRDASGVADLAPMRTYCQLKVTMEGIEKRIVINGPYSSGHLRHSANCVYIPHVWSFYDPVSGITKSQEHLIHIKEKNGLCL